MLLPYVRRQTASVPLLVTVKTDSACQLLVVMLSHVGNSKTDNYRLSYTWLGHARVASGRVDVLGQAVGHIPTCSCQRSKCMAPSVSPG